MKKIRTQDSCHGCGNNLGKNGKIACRSVIAKNFFLYTGALIHTIKDLGKQCGCPDIKEKVSKLK